MSLDPLGASSLPEAREDQSIWGLCSIICSLNDFRATFEGGNVRVSIKAIKGRLLVKTIEVGRSIAWSVEVTPQEGHTTPRKMGLSYTHAKKIREIIIP